MDGSTTAPGLERSAGSTTAPLTIALTIAALFFGSDIFVPIAIAILLSFVLAPGVRLLRAWHLGRVAPVIVMTILAFGVMAGLGALITSQLSDLTKDLPRYQDTVRHKIEILRSLTSESHLQQVTDFVSTLSQDLSRAQSNDVAPAVSGKTAAAPMAVVVQPADPTTLEMVGRLLAPLLHPLATAGIVVIFVVFILLQREDLRNRLIRLVGAGDLHRSTAAIDDAARRLSRLLLSQLALNATAGLLVGAALWVIGVPSPVLWGILFACLRFVPYLGPPLAAILPIGLAASVEPGWGMMAWTVATFVIIEPVLGQVIEPLLYGHNTGLSPVAVVLSATFWTALWGPIGLLLSTPITVCLVVLGRHVEHLRVFDLLLGDRPPLEPPEVFYQRMLANDPIEAADQAHELLRDKSLTEYYDTVVLPGLLLAQDDAAQGRLDTDHQRRIAAAAAELADDLSDAAAEHGTRVRPSLISKIAGRAEAADDAKTMLDQVPDPVLPAEWRAPGAVLCLGGRGPLDDAAALALAQLLTKHGFGAVAASHESLLNAHAGETDFAGARLIALSCLDGSGSAHLRFVMRRLRRRAPGATVLVCAWWRGIDPGAASPPADGPGDAQASTLSEAIAFCIGHVSPKAKTEAEPSMAMRPSAEAERSAR